MKRRTMYCQCGHGHNAHRGGPLGPCLWCDCALFDRYDIELPVYEFTVRLPGLSVQEVKRRLQRALSTLGSSTDPQTSRDLEDPVGLELEPVDPDAPDCVTRPEPVETVYQNR